MEWPVAASFSAQDLMRAKVYVSGSYPTCTHIIPQEGIIILNKQYENPNFREGLQESSSLLARLRTSSLMQGVLCKAWIVTLI